jgi:hypothetical protein
MASAAAAKTAKTLPKVETFDLLKSSEAFYMNSKTGQSSLRELLPKHDVLPKRAVKPESTNKASAFSAIREAIPFFGVQSEKASDTREYNDAESETIYNVQNSLPTTLAIGGTMVMLVVMGSSVMYMLYLASTLTPRAGPGGAPSTNWLMLAEAVGAGFLLMSVMGLYMSRSGLVRRIRFIPSASNATQVKPWLRSKALSKSGLDATRPEGMLEVTYRSVLPFSEQTESFNVRDMRVDRNIMTKRYQFEDDYWEMASIKMNERADGTQMGWFRRYLMEMTSIVFRKRTLNLSVPSTVLGSVLGWKRRTWKLDLLGFDGVTERGTLSLIDN